MHMPGACTIDHSTLQGPVWDWVEGYPEAIPNSKNNGGGVRLVANDDCNTCSDNNLKNTSICCTGAQKAPRKQCVK